MTRLAIGTTMAPRSFSPGSSSIPLARKAILNMFVNYTYYGLPVVAVGTSGHGLSSSAKASTVTRLMSNDISEVCNGELTEWLSCAPIVARIGATSLEKTFSNFRSTPSSFMPSGICPLV